MTGFGFGFGGHHRMVLRNVAAKLPQIEPSISWDGTAGSGFASIPIDPVRTTAKPTLRLIEPPNQAFTNVKVVGVMAIANDQGSLLTNLGIDKVVAHYEGQSVEITEPTFRTFNAANGQSVTYHGWWIELRHNSFNGEAELYFEAIARDPTMQRRVIGPYLYLPSPTLYDFDLEVAAAQPEIPGTRYQSILAAQNFLRSQGAQHPRISVIEAGTYPIPKGSFTVTIPGRVTIEASVPGVVLGDASRPISKFARIRPRMALHLKGANITVDFSQTGEIYKEGSQPIDHWLDGVNLTVSAGRYNLWNGGPLSSRATQAVRGSAWFTECTVSRLGNAFLNAELVRGCEVYETWNDLLTNASCAVFNTFDDHDSSDYKNDLPALDVTYSGNEPTATIDCPGDAYGANTSRTWTARWGSNSASLTVSGDFQDWASGTNATFQNVADWLNGLGVGFVATVLDNTRGAAAATLAGITSSGGFPEQSVKDETLTVIARFDVHADWYQRTSGNTWENGVVFGNLATNQGAQNIFINADTRDVVIANNAFSQLLEEQYLSQFYRNASHLVFAHNSFSGQAVLARSNFAPDGYCLAACNVAVDLNWPTYAELTPKDNHLYALALGPSGGLRTTIGGDSASLFLDTGSGNLEPSGELLANSKLPVLAYDIDATKRASSAPAGAH